LGRPGPRASRSELLRIARCDRSRRRTCSAGGVGSGTSSDAWSGAFCSAPCCEQMVTSRPRQGRWASVAPRFIAS
jgi:hypothetical protein